MKSQKQPGKLDPQQLERYALRLLSGRAFSSAELRDRLARRSESKSAVDALVAKLKSAGFLDDTRFAGHLAEVRRDNDRVGAARVLRELRARRVAPRIAGEAVRKAYQGADEKRLIEEYLARKYRRRPLHELLAEPRALASVYRHLRYAGFQSGPILQVLRNYRPAEELGVLEELPEEPEE